MHLCCECNSRFHFILCTTKICTWGWGTLLGLVRKTWKTFSLSTITYKIAQLQKFILQMGTPSDHIYIYIFLLYKFSQMLSILIKVYLCISIRWVFSVSNSIYQNPICEQVHGQAVTIRISPIKQLHLHMITHGAKLTKRQIYIDASLILRIWTKKHWIITQQLHSISLQDIFNIQS